jgi:hypothetical protein
MIRKILAAFALLSTAAFAQNVTGSGVASQFNQWQASGSVNLVAGANPLVTVSPCQAVAGGKNFPVLTASTPIKIVDPNNPSIDEVLTPTSITGGCTATFTTANAHTTPWYITSGTCGLQEAINNVAQSGVLNSIILDYKFHAFGCGQSTVYGAAGSANVSLVDVTISPNSAYRWNGTNYLSSYSYNTGSLTVAAGAAAGTGPTIANTTNGTANSWTVTLTTGTSPTTGTLFTETFGTAFPTGGANCVVQSVGANSSPALTVAATSTTVETISVTTAPTAATQYIFNGTCN